MKKIHGLSGTRLYSIWLGMMHRCLRKKHVAYSRYGGRGIVICDEWLKVERFYSDLISSYEDHVRKHGEKNTQLDRIDNNKGYFFSNVRWSTRKEQANNRRNNLFFLLSGERLSLSKLSEKTNIEEHILYLRLKNHDVFNAIHLKNGMKKSHKMLPLGEKKLNLSGCASLLGISRERARQLYNKGKLEQRLLQENML